MRQEGREGKTTSKDEKERKRDRERERLHAHKGGREGVTDQGREGLGEGGGGGQAERKGGRAIIAVRQHCLSLDVAVQHCVALQHCCTAMSVVVLCNNILCALLKEVCVHVCVYMCIRVCVRMCVCACVFVPTVSAYHLHGCQGAHARKY